MTCRNSIGSNVNISGNVDSIPQGISTGIKITKYTLTDAAWTLLGGVTDRRSMTVFNLSATNIVWIANDFYNPLPAVTTDALPTPANSQSTYNARETVDIYARLSTGSSPSEVKIAEFV